MSRYTKNTISFVLYAWLVLVILITTMGKVRAEEAPLMMCDTIQQIRMLSDLHFNQGVALDESAMMVNEETRTTGCGAMHVRFEVMDTVEMIEAAGMVILVQTVEVYHVRLNAEWFETGGVEMYALYIDKGK